MVKRFLNTLLFESRCSHCNTRKVENNGFLCSVCAKTLYPQPLKVFEFEFLNGAFSFAPYKGVGKTYLHLIKFQNAKSLIPILGKLVEPTFKRFFEEIKPHIVTFVPTHPFRVWFTRGFDQTEEFLKVIYPNYISIFRRSPIPQKPLYLVGNRVKRKIHLKGSFKLKQEFVDTIKDKKILIVDDLITTGSTGESLAYLLKSVGADSVHLFTVFYRIKPANAG